MAFSYQKMSQTLECSFNIETDSLETENLFQKIGVPAAF